MIIVVNGLHSQQKLFLYSQDPGSRSTGGKYTLNRSRPQMVKRVLEMLHID